MAERSIGGSLGMEALALLAGDGYDRRAHQHQPEGQQLHSEIRRLRAGGLTPEDVAGALRLPLSMVRDVLGEVEDAGGRRKP